MTRARKGRPRCVLLALIISLGRLGGRHLGAPLGRPHWRQCETIGHFLAQARQLASSPVPVGGANRAAHWAHWAPTTLDQMSAGAFRFHWRAGEHRKRRHRKERAPGGPGQSICSGRMCAVP